MPTNTLPSIALRCSAIAILLLVPSQSYRADGQELSVPSPAKAEPNNWPQFGGRHGNGVYDAAGPPLAWSENENIVWKTPIHDRGWSSPVIWEHQIWVTTATENGKQLFAVCVDRDSGTVTHDVKVFDVAEPEKIAPVNSYASPTSVIEDGRVYVHFGTYGYRKAYGTPTVYRMGDRLEMITEASECMYAHDPENGTELWKLRFRGNGNVPRPVYYEGLLYAVVGHEFPQLWAIKPGGNGELDEDAIVWRLTKGAPRTPSFVLVDGALFFVTGTGVAACLDAKSGEVIWRSRLGGNFSASLVSAASRVYFCDQAAVATVIEAGKEFKEITSNRLDGQLHASPAISGNSLFVRTSTHLYRIEQ